MSALAEFCLEKVWGLVSCCSSPACSPGPTSRHSTRTDTLPILPRFRSFLLRKQIRMLSTCNNNL